MTFELQMQYLNAAQRLWQESGQHDDTTRRALEKLATAYFWRTVTVGEDALAALPSARRGDYPTVRLEADND